VSISKFLYERAIAQGCQRYDTHLDTLRTLPLGKVEGNALGAPHFGRSKDVRENRGMG
jgi:hypothetical protein